MTESKSPLEVFARYFSVRTAVSIADRQQAYRIRYRVYCEEFEYEPKDRFSDLMERDEFDEIASHCLITHIATGLPAGCVRICPGSSDGVACSLPLEKLCSESLDVAAMAKYLRVKDQICEASRFAVDGAFRRRSGEKLTRFGEIASLDLTDLEKRTFPLLSLVLMLAGTAMAEIRERPYMFAVMEPYLPRLFQRSGMYFHRMGENFDYHGLRAVYVTDTRDFVRGLDGNLGELYSWISDRLKCIASQSPP